MANVRFKKISLLNALPFPFFFVTLQNKGSANIVRKMRTSIVHSSVGNRWNTLKYLDRNAKIDLITMLTQSLREPSSPKHTPANKYYGIWGDDGMTAEEFVNALREERRFNQDIVEL